MKFNNIKPDSTALNTFRTIALWEGVSFLVLLFIAMPLKYMAEIPAPVKYTGWAHGVLFVLYVITLVNVWIKYKWSFLKTTLAFLASLVPFGTFILDKQLKKEMISNPVEAI